MKICIYQDAGAELVPVLVQSINKAVKNISAIFPQLINTRTVTVSADDVKNGSCFQTCKLFVLPGGRDFPYVKKLHGVGVANIKKFVNQGGSLLGLCAGAYFSSCFVDFERGTPLEVIGKRELCLFKGTTRGCVYPGFDYHGSVSARMAPLTFSNSPKFPQFKNLGNDLAAYFNGGCEFIPDEGFRDYDVLADYSDYPGSSAIIHLLFGRGKVILSGVHPEMDPEFLDRRNYRDDQWAAIERYKDGQFDILKGVLQILML